MGVRTYLTNPNDRERGARGAGLGAEDAVC